MRIAAHVSVYGQGGVGLGEWGMDAQTGAAGYNFTIKIEVQLLGPGVGNGAISATIEICKKRSILLHSNPSRDIWAELSIWFKLSLSFISGNKYL